MKNTVLFFALLSLLWTACRDRSEPEVSPCGYCPNNTECIEDNCGCPPDKVDMGSWCIRKQENLFIAKDMLGCPCLDWFWLVFLLMYPALFSRPLVLALPRGKTSMEVFREILPIINYRKATVLIFFLFPFRRHFIHHTAVFLRSSAVCLI
jgi:hypothetical protein